jgi:hypothetical protein
MEESWKEWVVASLGIKSQHLLEGLSKATKKFRHGGQGQNFKLEPTELRARSVAAMVCVLVQAVEFCIRISLVDRCRRLLPASGMLPIVCWKTNKSLD